MTLTTAALWAGWTLAGSLAYTCARQAAHLAYHHAQLAAAAEAAAATETARMYGGPLDGETHPIPAEAAKLDDTRLAYSTEVEGKIHWYRSTGSTDPDGARRFAYAGLRPEL